ncbi:MAG: AAA family ATPase [Planctomycetaceae bacterium]|nr:AAA family ATPase [Planctomycetaceae bacterium]
MIAPELSHWQLQRAPFTGRLAATDYIPTAGQDEALARLRFLVEGRKRLGLMVGPAGTGKSLTLEVFAAQERLRAAVATRISLVGVEPTELLNRLIDAWQANVEHAATTSDRWAGIFARLAEFRVCRTPVTLLLDDVDQATPATLQVVLRLLLHDASPRWPLTIVLASRTEGAPTLPMRLLERVDLRIDVDAWTPDDTQAFVSDALRQAGRVAPLFQINAVESLHALTGGVARHVQQLAELALIAGAGQGLSQIDAEVIDSVHAELASV